MPAAPSRTRWRANPLNALANLVARICRPDPDDKEHVDELEAARKKWSARLDLTDADWVDVAEYATLGMGVGDDVDLAVRRGEDSRQAYRRAWSSFDALDQWAMVIRATGASGYLTGDRNYLVDAFGAKLTEVGRLAYIAGCIQSRGPVQWAMCQGDIDRLDVKKLAAELRANKDYGGHEKMKVRDRGRRPQAAARRARRQGQEVDRQRCRLRQDVRGRPGHPQGMGGPHPDRRRL